MATEARRRNMWKVLVTVSQSTEGNSPTKTLEVVELQRKPDGPGGLLAFQTFLAMTARNVRKSRSYGINRLYAIKIIAHQISTPFGYADNAGYRNRFETMNKILFVHVDKNKQKKTKIK